MKKVFTFQLHGTQFYHKKVKQSVMDEIKYRILGTQTVFFQIDIFCIIRLCPHQESPLHFYNILACFFLNTFVPLAILQV